MCVMPGTRFTLGPAKGRTRVPGMTTHRSCAYRVTTTVVPTLTRSKRSLMSWLYMRMQP